MRQRLGQHFLINKTAIGKAIAELDLRNGDVVVEIGPGKGVLTFPLAQKLQDLSGKLIAIEKDPALVDKLLRTTDRQRLPIQILSGDALKILATRDWPLATRRGWKLIGNIPYYITGHLLRILGEMENQPGSENSTGSDGREVEFLLPGKPQIAVLMVQKEVSERITAKPPKMNLLAAATQVWADISVIFRLKPKDFDPPPEVDSAIIKLATKYEKNYEYTKGELNSYYRFIHAAFKQPRKTLLNNVVEGYGLKKDTVLPILQKAGFNEKTRGQELGVSQLMELAKKTQRASF